MGNQAFITAKDSSLGIQLHWNGGRDSVEAFLRYAELAMLPPLDKSNQGLLAFVTMLCNFFGNDGGTVRIQACDPMRPGASSPGDNGVYVISGHEIVARHKSGFEQRGHDLGEMLKQIDAAQPAKDRLGMLLDAEEVPVDQIQVGDTVVLPNLFRNISEETGKYKTFTVLGFAAPLGGFVNGTKVTGMPYVDQFKNQDNAHNINSFIRTDTVWRERTN